MCRITGLLSCRPGLFLPLFVLAVQSYQEASCSSGVLALLLWALGPAHGLSQPRVMVSDGSPGPPGVWPALSAGSSCQLPHGGVSASSRSERSREVIPTQRARSRLGWSLSLLRPSDAAWRQLPLMVCSILWLFPSWAPVFLFWLESARYILKEL